MSPFLRLPSTPYRLRHLHSMSISRALLPVGSLEGGWHLAGRGGVHLGAEARVLLAMGSAVRGVCMRRDLVGRIHECHARGDLVHPGAGPYLRKDRVLIGMPVVTEARYLALGHINHQRIAACDTSSRTNSDCYGRCGRCARQARQAGQARHITVCVDCAYHGFPQPSRCALPRPRVPIGSRCQGHGS